MKRRLQHNFLSARGDSLGAFLSGACVVHCVALPSLAFMSPVLAQLSESEWVHLGLLFLLFPVAILTFVAGTMTHKSYQPLYWGGAGLGALIIALFMEGREFQGYKPEVFLTIVGSLLLCWAHFQNWSLKQKKEVAH